MIPPAPWSCRLKVHPGPATGGDPGGLRLHWHCVRLSTGHAIWSWNGQPVALTLFLGGRNADDARALEHWANVKAPQVPASLKKRVREMPRPLLATAYLHAGPSIRPIIARFALGLSQLLVEDFKIRQGTGPLGHAMARDFPPQFLHLVAAEGAMRKRLWVNANIFTADPDIRQVLGTFNDRLEDSFSRFDERLCIGTAKGQIKFRLRWQGLYPTAGIAEMIDGECIRHELLLVGARMPRRATSAPSSSSTSHGASGRRSSKKFAPRRARFC